MKEEKTNVDAQITCENVNNQVNPASVDQARSLCLVQLPACITQTASSADL